MEIYQKIYDVQSEIGKIGKDGDNPFFKSSYLTLEKLIDVLKPILIRNKVVMTQSVGYVDGQPTLDTTVTDIESGKDLKATMLLMCKSSDPQAQGSAITYARRYQIMALFGIVPSETDDDGNAATPAPIEQAMNKTQWATLGELLDEKGIKSRDDKITLVRALAGDKPLNTSAFARLEKEIKLAQPDTLQTILMDEQ